MSCVIKFVWAFNTLNISVLEPIIADNVIYDVQIFFKPIIGKEQFLKHTDEIFQLAKKEKMGIYIELGIYKKKQCAFMVQSRKGGINKICSYLFFTIENDKITKIENQYYFSDWKKVQVVGFCPPEIVDENKERSYMDDIIIPTNNDCLLHCKGANREYRKLKNKPPEKDLDILDWRMKYMALYDFDFTSNATNKDVILFKKNHDESIDYFYNLLEEKEANNKDERININYSNNHVQPYKNCYILTAYSPKDEAVKYNLQEWNKGLKNEKYYSFYLEGNPLIKEFVLQENEFEEDTFILTFSKNNKLRHILKSSNKIPQLKNIKELLFVTAKKFDESFRDIIHIDNIYEIERVI